MDYESILNKSYDDAPKDVLFDEAAGSYELTARQAKIWPPREEGKSPRLSVTYEVGEPQEDVDMQAYDALDREAVKATEVQKEFFMKTANDFKRIDKFIRAHGVDPAGKKWDDVLKELRKTKVIGVVQTRSYSKDGETEIVNTVTEVRPLH